VLHEIRGLLRLGYRSGYYRASASRGEGSCAAPRGITNLKNINVA
jgi:hypothetical protein